MSAARTERLLNLLTLLLNARRPVSLQDLRALDEFRAYRADDSKSGERAFERDKAALLTLGVPLSWSGSIADEEDSGGYSIDKARYFLEPVHLTPQQRALLGIAGAAAATLEGYSGRSAVRRALAKLGFDDASCEPDVPQQSLAHAPWPKGADVSRISEHLDILHGALVGLYRVQLQYVRGLDESAEAPQSRDVDPYGLYYQHGVWYLIGFCHNRRAVRTFHLGRVRRVTLTSGAKAFVLPADFDIRQAAQLRPWQYAKEPETLVVIRLAERLVPAVAEIFGPAVQVCRDATGPWVRLAVGHMENLIACVLPLGPAAEVIEPVAVRRRLRQLYAQLRQRYQTEPCVSALSAVPAVPGMPQDAQ